MSAVSTLLRDPVKSMVGLSVEQAELVGSGLVGDLPGDLPGDPDVIRTLARPNRIEAEGFGKQQSAGVYAKVLVPGAVRVGDPVAVIG